jgi:hypothetical protein
MRSKLMILMGESIYFNYEVTDSGECIDFYDFYRLRNEAK